MPASQPSPQKFEVVCVCKSSVCVFCVQQRYEPKKNKKETSYPFSIPPSAAAACLHSIGPSVGRSLFGRVCGIRSSYQQEEKRLLWNILVVCCRRCPSWDKFWKCRWAGAEVESSRSNRKRSRRSNFRCFAAACEPPTEESESESESQPGAERCAMFARGF